jgi:hypothetical protein
VNLMTRYNDAYLAARTINGAGQIIKGVGFVLAGLIALSGFTVAGKGGISFAIGGLLFGALVALPFYAVGVLVASQGQILKATLDTAVNSSPLLSHDEIREILRLSYAEQQGQHPSASKTICDRCGKSFPSHFYLQKVGNGQDLCEGCRQTV